MIIGFVSGCFDWMTPGHVRLFKEAKNHCHVLHMLMADDETVTHYKGPSRPLLTYDERVELVSACKYIDEIHKLRKIPEDSNQYELIRSIKPHIYFEGADATDKEIAVYLDTLNINRRTLNTPPLHVSDVLDRYMKQIVEDASEAHRILIEVAGL